jgi:YVTN family beta-propeller protein
MGGTGNAQGAWARRVGVASGGSGLVTVIKAGTGQVRAAVRTSDRPFQIVVTLGGTIGYVLNGVSSVVGVKVGAVVTARTVRAARYPLGLAITPDGETVYISRHSNTGPGSVLPVRAATGRAGRPVYAPLSGGDIAGPLTVTPDGKTVLAAETFVGNASREGILPIRIPGNVRGRIITFGDPQHQPRELLVTPDSRTVFVLSFGLRSDLLSQLRLVTGKVMRSLKLPSGQNAMAMTPDGRLLYLANPGDNTVTVVKTTTNTILSRVRVNLAWSLAISPDGKTVYVGCADQLTGDPEVVTIATATNQPSSPVLLDQSNSGTVDAVAVGPDGRTAYFGISTIGGFVVPMNTATRTLRAPVPVAPEPTAVAIGQHGSTVWIISSNF